MPAPWEVHRPNRSPSRLPSCCRRLRGRSDKKPNNLDNVFSRLVEKGRLTDEESVQIKAAFVEPRPDALASAEFVIEAIVEDLSIKTNLFQRLEHIVGQDTVLATNLVFVRDSLAKVANVRNRSLDCTSSTPPH